MQMSTLFCRLETAIITVPSQDFLASTFQLLQSKEVSTWYYFLHITSFILLFIINEWVHTHPYHRQDLFFFILVQGLKCMAVYPDDHSVSTYPIWYGMHCHLSPCWSGMWLLPQRSSSLCNREVLCVNTEAAFPFAYWRSSPLRVRCSLVFSVSCIYHWLWTTRNFQELLVWWITQ